MQVLSPPHCRAFSPQPCARSPMASFRDARGYTGSGSGYISRNTRSRRRVLVRGICVESTIITLRYRYHFRTPTDQDGGGKEYEVSGSSQTIASVFPICCRKGAISGCVIERCERARGKIERDNRNILSAEFSIVFVARVTLADKY